MQEMSQPGVTKPLWGQGWDVPWWDHSGGAESGHCLGTLPAPAAGRGAFGAQLQVRACLRRMWLPGHFSLSRGAREAAPALPLLGPRLIPCCVKPFALFLT